MKAISVWQPWAWAIASEPRGWFPRPKRWENRPSWANAPGILAQARKLVGHRIAIHAAARGVFSEYAQAIGWMIGAGLVESPGPLSFALPRGVIVATAVLDEVAVTRFNGCRVQYPDKPLTVARCSLCGEHGREAERCPQADPWADPTCVGFALTDVVVLEKPVPWKGRQGFFEVGDVSAFAGGGT